MFWVLHTPSLGCRAVPSGRLELCEAEAPADAIFLDRQAPGNHAFDLSKEIFHLETSWDLKARNTTL